MNDLQAKFAVALVAYGLFFAYTTPAVKQAKQDHESVTQQVGMVYIAPSPNDPKAPNGMVSVEELQKYAAEKAAADRRALGLQ